jgi:hypothetical protein
MKPLDWQLLYRCWGVPGSGIIGGPVRLRASQLIWPISGAAATIANRATTNATSRQQHRKTRKQVSGRRRHREERQQQEDRNRNARKPREKGRRRGKKCRETERREGIGLDSWGPRPRPGPGNGQRDHRGRDVPAAIAHEYEGTLAGTLTGTLGLVNRRGPIVGTGSKAPAEQILSPATERAGSSLRTLYRNLCH